MAVDPEHDVSDEAPSKEARDGRLRPAMFEDDEEPRFPWWLPFPGLALALGWAAYQGFGTADGGGISEAGELLLWPGAAIFLATTVTAYFGWRLDLD